MKIVVISNLHYAKTNPPAAPYEQGRNADIFLLRTVHRINRWIKPDAVIIGGTVTDQPDDADAMAELKPYLEKLEMPLLLNGAITVEDHCFSMDAALDDTSKKIVRIDNQPDGVTLSTADGWSVKAPDLCRAPFRYMIVTFGTKTAVQLEELALPDGYFDSHIHTRFAYCQENLDPFRQLELTKLFNLERFAFTEHSGHLYATSQDYGNKTLQRNGLANTFRQDRAKDYLAMLDELEQKGSFIRGFELDVDRSGDIIVLPEDLARVNLKVGAVHWLDAGDDREAQKQDFLFRTEKLLAAGCHVLAHPFRIFGWSHPPVPTELFEPVMRLLKQYGAAAEVNFHYNSPEPEFFRMCLENGVKIAFGSDTHNLYELGEFYANIRFLEQIGGTKDDLFRFGD